MPNQELDEKSITESEPDDYEDYSSLNSFIGYLKSKEGNTVVNRLLGFIEEFNHKKIELEKETALFKKKLSIHYFWTRLIVLVLSIVAVTGLVYYGKFESAPALFFGAVVAYLFGKDPK